MSHDALLRPMFDVRKGTDGAPITGTGTNAWSDFASTGTAGAMTEIVHDTHGLILRPGDGGGATVLQIDGDKWAGFWRLGARIQLLTTGLVADDYIIPAVSINTGGGFSATPLHWGDYIVNKSTVIPLGGWCWAPPVELNDGFQAKGMFFHDATGSGLVIDAQTTGFVTRFCGWFLGKNADVHAFDS